MNNKEFEYFKSLENENITEEDLGIARKKSIFLKNMKDKFLLLIEMVEEVIKGKYQLDISNLIMIIGAIIYVVNPGDIIPDIFLGLGYVDDIMIIEFIFKRLDYEISRYRERKI